MSKLWLTNSITKHHPVAVDGSRIGVLPLTWADGMVGVMPVFDDEQKAIDYAGSSGKVYELEKVEEE